MLGGTKSNICNCVICVVKCLYRGWYCFNLVLSSLFRKVLLNINITMLSSGLLNTWYEWVRDGLSKPCVYTYVTVANIVLPCLVWSVSLLNACTNGPLGWESLMTLSLLKHSSDFWKCFHYRYNISISLSFFRWRRCSHTWKVQETSIFL